MPTTYNNCFRTRTETDEKPWGKTHVLGEDYTTLCGLTVQGSRWYLETLNSLKVTCPKCRERLEEANPTPALKDGKANKDWLRTRGTYVDRFLISPRDIAAEFFEFLNAEGKLKK